MSTMTCTGMINIILRRVMASEDRGGRDGECYSSCLLPCFIVREKIWSKCDKRLTSAKSQYWIDGCYIFSVLFL